MKNVTKCLTEVGEIMLTYQITETEHEDLCFYGVSVTSAYEDGKTENATIDDIMSDKHKIQALIKQLLLGKVTPVSLPDIIEDFISC